MPSVVIDRVKFFVLPHAGGASYAYNKLKEHLGKNVDYVAYEMPGRGSRIHESLIRSMDMLVEDAYQTLIPQLEGQPYVIYGHSLGSVLGYLLIKRLIDEGKTLPVYIFFSGRRGVHYTDPVSNTIKHTLPRTEFISVLRDLGGVPGEILDDDAIMDFFDPIIRADFELLEKFRYVSSEKFDIPITVLLGKEDKATHAAAIDWAQETTRSVDVHYFEGGHFFVFEHAQVISKLINATLVSLCAGPKVSVI